MMRLQDFPDRQDWNKGSELARSRVHAATPQYAAEQYTLYRKACKTGDKHAMGYIRGNLFLYAGDTEAYQRDYQPALDAIEKEVSNGAG